MTDTSHKHLTDQNSGKFLDQNLATKYRPLTYNDVVGQDIPKSVLKKIALSPGIACRSIFLKGSWGSGKCVLGDTRVAISEGYLPIKNVFDGHEGFNDFITKVYTRYGVRTSSHWYKQRNCLVINHKLASGFVINGTPEHKVLAYHNNRVDLHRMDDLTIGDTILLPKTKIGDDWHHNVDLAYATGLWLGDGFIHKGVMGFCGTKAMCEKFAKLAGWSGSLTKDKRRNDLYTVRELKGDQSLIRLSGTSHDKEIPEYIFCSDIESRIAFLQGLLETDGTISSKNDVEWTMCSEKLIKQLQEVFHTLGVSGHISTKVVKYGEREGVTWRLRVPANQANFILTKNGRTWSHKDSMNDRNIIKVDGQLVCNSIRRHRIKFANRHKSDIGANISSNVKVWNAITERSIIKYKEFYGELPSELEGLIGYNYEPIVDTTFTTADVYDLSVPDVHEFYCQGTYNHNTTLARIFAKSMNCQSFPETGEVCNSCDSCKDVAAKNSQLYLEFDATTAGNIDSIRSLHDKLSYLPPKGGRRVIVLDEVHACSSSALNALLKLVEEGIPSTIFVFCSTEDILPTLKSRSICLDITTIPPHLMGERIKEVAYKESISISELDIQTICTKSLGHMRDAMSLLQLYSLAGSEVLKTPTDLLYKFIISSLKKDRSLALSLIPSIMDYPTTDIATSLANLIKSIYTSSPDSQMNLLLKNGMVNKLFQFFYTPVAQQALRSEVGTELLLRSFLEKTNPHG